MDTPGKTVMYYEAVEKDFGSCLGSHVTRGIGLRITGEVVCNYQDVLLSSLGLL
jgi:hypothetical protein